MGILQIKVISIKATFITILPKTIEDKVLTLHRDQLLRQLTIR